MLLLTSSEPFFHKETLMRRLPTTFFASLALAAGVTLAALPASAQSLAVPPEAPSVSVSDLAPLVIPAPPGGKLRVEMDARSEDLLGMVKSFLKGIGETGPPPTAPGQTPAPPNPIAQAISGGDLAALLKNVNHVHFVVYEIPGADAAASPVSVQVTPVRPGLKKNVQITVITPPAPVTPAVPAFDSNSFYENAFASEGAHRILYTDADAYKLVMVGFPDQHGFAFAASGGGYVVVERSDGYPDLEVLSAFISRLSSAALNSPTIKKAMTSAMSSSPLSMPESKTLLNK
jgi:hypothetical protein